MKFVLSGAFAPVANLPALAIAADDHGWEMISLSDHTVNPEIIKTPYPYTPDGKRRWPEFTEWPDQLVMMGAFAPITKRLRFTTNAFVLPLRNPFLVAKALATLSVISGNRITLTIGVGWSKDEFQYLGQDFSTRGRRTDEMIEVMRTLWSGRYVSFKGEFWNFERVEMNPAPAGPIPLWVGGISDAALKRAARIGDGWLTDWQSTDDIARDIGKIRTWRQEYGRPGGFDVMAMPSDAFDYDSYRRLEDKGVTHVLTAPWHLYHADDPLNPQKQVDSVKRYADDMIAKFS